MERTAAAAWAGGLKDGTGTVSTDSGVLSNYGYQARFEEAAGTNPEELIAAAHAACFSMALAAQVEACGLKAESIRTSAEVTLEEEPGGFSITAIHLDTLAKVPGITWPVFETAAAKAQSSCPTSRLLKVRVTLAAKLEV